MVGQGAAGLLQSHGGSHKKLITQKAVHKRSKQFSQQLKNGNNPAVLHVHPAHGIHSAIKRNKLIYNLHESTENYAECKKLIPKVTYHIIPFV